MEQHSYRDRDYPFGQMMLTLRTAVGLTQTALADYLGVSRRAVGEWEAGAKYPKTEHLKQFIVLAARNKAFHAGREAQEVRALWKAARQKVLLDETWLSDLVATPSRNQSGDTHVPAFVEESERKTQHRRTPRQQASPIPNSRDAAPTLPFQPTPFVGRQAELATIASLLSDPACRLLTLFGPGGVGKTRLALEAAAQQAHAFADGIAFVALASVSSPNQIAHAIGDVLDLDFSAPVSPGDVLLDHLRDRNLLLVLDNFEHLLDGSALVNDILQQARFVTVLVTSRTRLQLRAEWLFEVEGLSFPPDATALTSQNLADYSAVQLFVQRAAQVRSGLPIPVVDLATVARICEHVAGIPLAIELAAASAPIRSLEDIEQAIYANLGVLETSLRDVPVRHRSLRAAFDHSWNLLSESEQVTFIHLAVFRGGCSLEAAKQVTGATLWELTGLVNKSLLRQVASTGEEDREQDSEPRFIFLEPLREYALEKLAAQEEMEPLLRAFATYFLELAEAVDGQWDRPTAGAAIQQLDDDYDNIRAVLHWAGNGGDVGIGFQLSGALRKFWQRRGYYSEGRAWLEDLLAVEGDDPEKAALEARLIGVDTAAWLASDQHDYARARQLFEEDMALRRSLGDNEGWSQTLSHAGREARVTGQYQQATSFFEGALARHRALGDRGSASAGGLGNSLFELALVVREQGNFARAEALFEECLQLHRELEDRDGMTEALLGLGDIARDQGDADTTRHYAEQSLAMARELGAQWAIGYSLNNLALADYRQGDLSHAFALVSESEAVFLSLHSDGGRAEILITKGLILAAQTQTAAGQDALRESLRVASVIGPRLMVAAALEALARIMTEPSQAREMVRLLGAVATLRLQMGTPTRPADQPAVERALANARTILGSSALAIAWSEAQQQSLEQIIGEILGVVPDAATAAPQPEPEPAPLPRTQAVHSQVQAVRREDWGDAPSIPTFYGREWELKRLTEWIVQDHCRIVGVLGLGGIGKSALSISVMYQVAEHFEVVIWRSLRDAPRCEALLDDCLRILAPLSDSQPSVDLEQRLNLFLKHLREQRILVVLDNLESLLDEGEETGRLRPGYEDYERLLRRVGETQHQSCLLFTSREKPANRAGLEGSQSPVRTLRLARLESKPSEQLLAERGVSGTDAERAQLIDLYAANPLALKIVSQTIADLFEGDIAPFLAQGEIIFGGIRSLLDQQFARVSVTERCVLLWLAIMREPSSLDELLEAVINPIPRARLMEAIEALYRRSLIERGHKRGSFTLQSVVLEYATAYLVFAVGDDVLAGNLTHLVDYGLELAQSHEYVRQTQQRLIVAPVLAYLQSKRRHQSVMEEQLVSRLAQLGQQPVDRQGYAPANVLALLRELRGHLRGLDLSRLSIRGAYLQGVDMQDTRLDGARIQNSVFTESFDVITAVAISAAGTYWAAAGRRGEIRVWVAGGKTILRMWQGHPNMIYHLAFSPDERLLASGGWDGSVKLWEVDGGDLLWSGNHANRINNVAFSPDGMILASSSDDTTLRLWDASSGTLLHVLPHPVPVSGDGVTWSPDGRMLASGDLEGIIRLWKIDGTQPPALLQTFKAHSAWIDGLAFSPDGNILASASFDETVKLWQIPGGDLLHTLNGHIGRVFRIAWSPDGRTLASSSFDQTVLLWDMKRSIYRAVLRGHSAGVVAVAFTPDSANLLSGSEDGTLRLWDVEGGQCLRVSQGYAISLSGVDWSPDATKLVAGGSDATVTVWDVNGKTPLRALHGHRGVVIDVGWSPNGRWLASSEWDNAIRLWNPISGECLQVIGFTHDEGNFFGDIAWSPDGQCLACTTFRHGVQVFDLATNRFQWAGQSSLAWVRCVAWNPDGTLLAGGCDDGVLLVWDFASELPRHQLTGHHGPISSVVWSPSGTLLASGGGDQDGGQWFVWNIAQAGNPQVVQSGIGNPGIVKAVAWAADEQVVITGDGVGRLRWWDIATGQCLLARETHQGTGWVRRSPDGKTLASCGDNGMIMLWNLHTGEHLQILRHDRPYERLNITGIRGLTEAQKSTLLALGAVDYTISQENGSLSHQ